MNCNPLASNTGGAPSYFPHPGAFPWRILLAYLALVLVVCGADAYGTAQRERPRPTTQADLELPVRLGYPLIAQSEVKRPGAACFEALWEWSPNLPNEPTGWRRVYYDTDRFDPDIPADELPDPSSAGVPLPERLDTATRPCPPEI